MGIINGLITIICICIIALTPGIMTVVCWVKDLCECRRARRKWEEIENEKKQLKK